MQRHELNNLNSIFGPRYDITFKCNTCQAAFAQELRFINGFIANNGYELQTQCPICKKIITAYVEDELGLI